MFLCGLTLPRGRISNQPIQLPPTVCGLFIINLQCTAVNDVSCNLVKFLRITGFPVIGPILFIVHLTCEYSRQLLFFLHYFVIPERRRPASVSKSLQSVVACYYKLHCLKQIMTSAIVEKRSRLLPRWILRLLGYSSLAAAIVGLAVYWFRRFPPSGCARRSSTSERSANSSGLRRTSSNLSDRAAIQHQEQAEVGATRRQCIKRYLYKQMKVIDCTETSFQSRRMGFSFPRKCNVSSRFKQKN